MGGSPLGSLAPLPSHHLRVGGGEGPRHGSLGVCACGGEPWRQLGSLPQPGPAALAVPAVLTADCGDQPGCLGAELRAGFPERRRLQRRCVLGVFPPCSPLLRASGLAGQVGCDRAAVQAWGSQPGNTCIADMVLPEPGNVTEGPWGGGAALRTSGCGDSCWGAARLPVGRCVRAQAQRLGFLACTLGVGVGHGSCEGSRGQQGLARRGCSGSGGVLSRRRESEQADFSARGGR